MPRPIRKFIIGLDRQAVPAAGYSVLALLAWLVGSWASPVLAEEAAATDLDEPRFLIEALDVVGNQRVTDEILIAESLLVPGRSYREGELREAVFRLRRLPFIFDAGFRLARGSERGQYRLVIEIDEVRRYFFGDNIQVTSFGGDNDVSLNNVLAGQDSVSVGPLAGARFFFGRHHEIFGSVALDRGVQLGYNRYDLFDRRAVLTIGLTAQTCCPSQVFPLGLDPTFTVWEGSGEFREGRIALGIPLASSRHLRVAASYSTSEKGLRTAILGTGVFRRSLSFRDLDTAQLELVWSDDTTDDPIFPSRGRRRSLTLDVQHIEADLVAPLPIFAGDPVTLPDGIQFGDTLPRTRSEQLRLAFADSRHWSLGRRQTLSVTGRVAVGSARIQGLARLDQDCSIRVFSFCASELVLLDDDSFTLWEASLEVSHSVRLGSDPFRRDHGDLRLETTAEVGWDDNGTDVGLDGDPLARRSLGVAVVYRNRWGLFRAGFQWVDYAGGA